MIIIIMVQVITKSRITVANATSVKLKLLLN